jgi:phage baseplate assembly protein W
MTESYFILPLNPGEIIRKKELPRISLKDSVSAWLHLLLVTHFGECKHDDTFGCEIWEHDFENIDHSQKFKEKIQKAVLSSIIRHEPRLSDIRLEIIIEQVEIVLQNKRVKIRISVNIKGLIKKTNEQFVHSEGFFIGPLSYY